jgi:hypothetical protein
VRPFRALDRGHANSIFDYLKLTKSIFYSSNNNGVDRRSLTSGYRTFHLEEIGIENGFIRIGAVSEIACKSGEVKEQKLL